MNKIMLYVITAAFIAGCVGIKSNTVTEDEGGTAFRLHGGYFYGPGPIEPASPLPDGKISNVNFDKHKFKGQTAFRNDGSKKSILSDGKTRINQNIDAGWIKVGEEKSRSFFLSAVDGGPNSGNENYYLDPDYNFNWRVDLALDPGFSEGIVRVNDLVLTTGFVRVPLSIQSQRKQPGGYDQAGIMKSGEYILGRLGDFDQDGFLDGVLVASPNVPMEDMLLPGSPVVNERGFSSNIEIPPHLACELTLVGVLNLKKPLKEILTQNNIPELIKMIETIRMRLTSARTNLERSLTSGAWKEIKREGFLITWQMDKTQTLGFMSWAFLTGYEHPSGKVPVAVVDSTDKMFAELESLIVNVKYLNEKTGDTLPSI